MEGVSLFRARDSRAKSQFRSVSNIRQEAAKVYRQTVGKVLERGAPEIFVPFLNERKLGKLVLEPLNSPARSITQRPKHSVFDSQISKHQRSDSNNSLSPSKKWTLNSVNAKRWDFKPCSQETSQETNLCTTNLYSKTNLLVYREIRQVEPPDSVPMEDK